jgi:CheY-like chemotaxis protein
MEKLKILLVDDDQINNYLNVSLLNKMSIASQIDVFEDGEKALLELKERSGQTESFPDLIFVDINMPIIDGFEFLSDFKKLQFTKDCKLIMLSTSESPKDEEKVLELGSRVLSKPLTEEKIFAIINER